MDNELTFIALKELPAKSRIESFEKLLKLQMRKQNSKFDQSLKESTYFAIPDFLVFTRLIVFNFSKSNKLGNFYKSRKLNLKCLIGIRYLCVCYISALTFTEQLKMQSHTVFHIDIFSRKYK